MVNQPLVPEATTPGGATFTLTVNGTGFVSGSVVNWNGTALTTTFVSSSELTAAVTATDIATPGTASVTVTNPAPGGGTSNVAFFDVSPLATSLTFAQLPPNPGFNASVGPIATGDFNGDGKLDLAYLVGSPVNSVVIQLGNGDGTFQVPVNYAVGDTPQVLVVGDFDGDGKLDLAVGNYFGQTVSVLLGNGDGTFQAQTTSPLPGGAYALVAGDFNGDGKLDLAVGNVDVNIPNATVGVSILLGNGDGTFQSHVDYDTSSRIFAMTIGDFNRDGNLDLVYVAFDVANGAALLTFLQGNGDGTFQPPVGVPMNPDTESLMTADLNGDGKLDLIAVGDPGGVSVLLGNGDGTFGAGSGFDTGASSNTLTVADFNAGLNLDIAVNDQPNFSLDILLGNGDGTFQSPLNFLTPQTDVYGAGDFNGDGKMDFEGVVSNNGISSIVLLLQGQIPVVGVSPAALAFSQQAIGTTSPPKNVTLTNTGTGTMTISNISITGINANDFAQTDTCSSTLAVGANCQISVTFTPASAGNPSAVLNISDNAPGSTQAVSLAGATLTFLSPASVTFPNQYVGTSGLPQTVTLTNTGTAALTITGVSATLGDFAPLSACGNSLGPGSSCSIGVFFDPTTSGTRSGTLTVTDNAGGSPQTVTLSGAGEDFSMAPSGQTSATVTPGQTASYTLSVAPGGGFNQTVAMSCSGAPTQSTCSLSSSSVALNGSKAATVTVTVTTAGSSAGLTQPFGGPPYGGALAWLVFSSTLGLTMLLSLAKGLRARRPQQYGLAFLCLLSIGVTLSACGSGSNSSSGDSGSGTPVGSYNLAVTGTFTSGSTTLTHTTKLTLVVQ